MRQMFMVKTLGFLLCAAGSGYEMACYTPLTAWRAKCGRQYLPKDKKGYPTGKWPITFNRSEAFTDFEIKIPCGQCIGCRLERSRQWAIRCVHESKLYTHNQFLTLTYRPGEASKSVNLETGEINAGELLSLNKRDIMLFLKRLRKHYGPGIRFFQCGEYGSELERPHHHAIIFNLKIPDRTFWATKRGVRLYTSETINKIWGHGYCVIGDVTFESAAYVARYITKKITGPIENEHYLGRSPEFITMSRKPGIGRGYFELYKDDVYPSDQCVIRPDLITRPPKYYDSIYDLQNPSSMAIIKRKRKAKVVNSNDCTPQRLLVRMKCHQLAARKLIRGYEKGELLS